MSTVTEQDVMKNFTKALSGSVLEGTARIDEAIKVSTKFNSLQDVIENMVADCANAGNAETFMRDYCGIENQNNGTYNSKYGYYLYDGKTYQDILPQNGGAVYPAETTFDANGLIVTIPEESSLTDQEKLVVEGAYSWWLKDAAKLVEDTYNVDFNGHSINFGFEYGGGSYGAQTYRVSKTMCVNMDSDVATTLKAGDNGNGLKTYDPYGIAAILSHEMTHVVQHNFNIPSYTQDEGIPLYITEGMGDLTAGRYYVNRVDSLAGNANTLNEVLNTFGERADNLHYTAGFLFWHYLMKKTADSADDTDKDYSKLTFNGTSDTDLGYAGYVNFGNGSNYSLGGGDDTLYIYGENVSVDGGDGGDYISNFAANVTITGGTGDDTVYMGGEWNNVLNYKYGDGNDTVYNFHEHDQMQISGAEHFTVASGDDVIVNVGSGQVLLKGANGKSLDIVNSYSDTGTGGTDIKREYAYTYNFGNETISDYQSWENIKFNGNYSYWTVDGNDFIINAAEGSLRVKNAKDKMIELYDKNDEILMHVSMQDAGNYFEGTVYDEDGNTTYGTYYEKVVVVGANDGNNTIMAGAGGSELWGNGGINWLIGGEGEDTFIYNYGRSK